jgi:hypothetical protein
MTYTILFPLVEAHYESQSPLLPQYKSVLQKVENYHLTGNDPPEVLHSLGDVILSIIIYRKKLLPEDVQLYDRVIGYINRGILSRHVGRFDIDTVNNINMEYQKVLNAARLQALGQSGGGWGEVWR